jgi:hypothetical protein
MQMKLQGRVLHKLGVGEGEDDSCQERRLSKWIRSTLTHSRGVAGVRILICHLPIPPSGW